MKDEEEVLECSDCKGESPIGSKKCVHCGDTFDDDDDDNREEKDESLKYVKRDTEYRSEKKDEDEDEETEEESFTYLSSYVSNLEMFGTLSLWGSIVLAVLAAMGLYGTRDSQSIGTMAFAATGIFFLVLSGMMTKNFLFLTAESVKLFLRIEKNTRETSIAVTEMMKAQRMK